MRTAPRNLLLLLFAAMQVCFLGLLAVYNWNDHLPAFLALYLAACAAYAVAAGASYRGAFEGIAGVSNWILAGGILLRLTVLWCPPTISEDVYRYVWDGKVQNAGFSPYDYPPEDPALSSLRDADYEKINHKDFRTAYPPAAQILFRGLAAVSTDHFLFKCAICGFDVLLLFLIRGLLAAEKRPPALLLVYAWHPLAALEFSANGHMDVIAISLMFLSFLLLARSRPGLSGAALGAAVLTKYLPAASLPWLLPRGKIRFAATFAVILIVLFVPYYTPDLRIFRGLSTFYQKWWFNDSIFGFLRLAFGSAEPARLTGAAFMAGTAAWALWKRMPLYRSFFLINAVMIAFAPVVHPWYVLWLAPLLVFHRNPAWLFFTCWVAVSYMIRYVNPTQVWQHPAWLRLAVYAPLYGLLLVDLVRGLKKPAAG